MVGPINKKDGMDSGRRREAAAFGQNNALPVAHYSSHSGTDTAPVLGALRKVAVSAGGVVKSGGIAELLERTSRKYQNIAAICASDSVRCCCMRFAIAIEAAVAS